MKHVKDSLYKRKVRRGMQNNAQTKGYKAENRQKESIVWDDED